MPKVTMVQHINVQITNRQRSQQWYEKVLDARFRDRGPGRVRCRRGGGCHL